MADIPGATIVLDHPVEIAAEGRTIEEVRMRRPRVRDQRAATRAADNDADRELRLFASLTDLPPEAIDEFDLADYRKLQIAFEGFLSG
jgi:hypothetical protein